MVDSRSKGRKYERHVEIWMEEHFGDLYVRRNRSGYEGEDFGLADIFCGEIKNTKQGSLGTELGQAVDQAAQVNEVALLIKKRVGKSDVGQHYAIMRAKDFAFLMQFVDVDRMVEALKAQ